MSGDLTKFNPSSFDELLTLCKMLSGTQLVPRALHGKVDDVMAIVMMGADLRLSPMQSLQNISCINGKVTIWGDGLLAIVQGHPNFAGMKEWIENANSPDAVAYCLVKRRCGDDVMETLRGFSVDQAKRASLWGNKGPWSQYPERMLQMRARAFACRDAFADALRGIMPREEVMDYNDRPAGNVPMQHAALDAVVPPQVTAPEPEEAEYATCEDVEPEPLPKKSKKPTNKDRCLGAIKQYMKAFKVEREILLAAAGIKNLDKVTNKQVTWLVDTFAKLKNKELTPSEVFGGSSAVLPPVPPVPAGSIDAQL